jgi:hypothetical protein
MHALLRPVGHGPEGLEADCLSLGGDNLDFHQELGSHELGNDDEQE